MFIIIPIPKPSSHVRCPSRLVLGLFIYLFFLSLPSFGLTKASPPDCTAYGRENFPRKWRGRTLRSGCGLMPPNTPQYIRPRYTCHRAGSACHASRTQGRQEVLQNCNSMALMLSHVLVLTTWETSEYFTKKKYMVRRLSLIHI